MYESFLLTFRNKLSIFVGCKVFFTCYVITCLQKEPSFGADTDEEEEERDDNLLPM